MNSTNPEYIYGTWEQITDRFMYCANSSGATGGSSTITVENWPSHNHTFAGVEVTDDLQYMNLQITDYKYTEGQNEDYIVHLEEGELVFNFDNTSGVISYSGILTSETYSSNDIRIRLQYTPTGSISTTGSGSEFLHTYITVYAWYRKASKIREFLFFSRVRTKVRKNMTLSPPTWYFNLKNDTSIKSMWT